MRTPGLHRTLWRWHFLAGLLACPLVLVVALTGAVYAFQPELESWLDAELVTVPPAGDRQAFDRLVAALPPTCTTTGIEIPAGRDRALRVSCAEGSWREVLIDPYRGAVLGQRDWGHSFFGIIYLLHWELLLGDPGRLAIEWATSWSLLLFISGAALWWPRGKRRGGGVWWPRRALPARRRLRDLHAVLGAYAVPALFVMGATGLFWTLMAGQKRWQPLAGDALQAAWDARPTSTAVAGAPRIGFDAALRAAGIDPATEWREVYVAEPETPDAPYVLYAYDGSHEQPSAHATIWVDAYSGRRLRQVTWADRSALGKIDRAAYPIHVGALVGLPGRILACIAALILAGLSVTGPWMWWKRRPRGRFGAPSRARQAHWPLLALLAGLGWLLPTVGWSLIAVLVVEAAVWIGRRCLGGPTPPATAG